MSGLTERFSEERTREGAVVAVMSDIVEEIEKVSLDTCKSSCSEKSDAQTKSDLFERAPRERGTEPLARHSVAPKISNLTTKPTAPLYD